MTFSSLIQTVSEQLTDKIEDYFSPLQFFCIQFIARLSSRGVLRVILRLVQFWVTSAPLAPVCRGFAASARLLWGARAGPPAVEENVHIMALLSEVCCDQWSAVCPFRVPAEKRHENAASSFTGLPPPEGVMIISLEELRARSFLFFTKEIFAFVFFISLGNSNGKHHPTHGKDQQRLNHNVLDAADRSTRNRQNQSITSAEFFHVDLWFNDRYYFLTLCS